MKNVLCSILIMLTAVVVSNAQDLPGLDKSPMDMSVLRVDRNTPPLVKVYYSRPAKKGRKIFGELVPYNKVWRTGANEATEITFYQDTQFGGKKVKAGTYALYTIPGEKKWTIILNETLNQWGAYNYDEKKDVIRVEASATKTDKEVESFTITFGTDEMIMAWDDTLVSVPVKTK